MLIGDENHRPAPALDILIFNDDVTGVDIPSFRPLPPNYFDVNFPRPWRAFDSRRFRMVMPDDEANTQCNSANWIVVRWGSAWKMDNLIETR